MSANGTTSDGERPIPAVSHDDAERNSAYQAQVAKQINERNLSALSDMICGGLYVTDGDELDERCDPERAVLHIAGGLLRCITLAVASSGGDDQGVDGWALDETKLSHAQLVAALSGVTAYVSNARRAIDSLRERKEFRSSCQRSPKEQDAQVGAS